MKHRRVIIVHGWADRPGKGWQAWLARELTKQGAEVVAPAMPNPKLPKLADWQDTLTSSIGKIDANTILVGHSLGTFALLRFLEQYSGPEKAGQLILVAGFLTNGGKSLKPYFSPAPDVDKIHSHVKEVHHVFSTNDKMVAPKRSKELAELLGGKTYQMNDYGHFMTGKLLEFPLVLEIITNY
jgi:predicted alpha/beta hydrolase family esterase